MECTDDGQQHIGIVFDGIKVKMVFVIIVGAGIGVEIVLQFVLQSAVGGLRSQQVSVLGVLRRVLEGFAAGVMTAASVWSLLLPAIDWADMGRWSFLPAAGGFWLGVLFLRLLERLLPEAVTDRSTTMTLLAVTLHNIPEGMAVGAAYAGCVAAGAAAPAAAFTLALAIAIQNVPEGAIVALPLRTAGAGKGRAFLGGVLSGAVEPLAAGVTVLAAALIVPALPWLLGFAAGAMLYVVAAELLPTRGDSGPGALAFAAGFTVMMILDVALG